MVERPVGIRSLAICFPPTIRTNEYWQNKHPYGGTQGKPRRVRRPELTESSGDRGGFQLWSQAVAPYLPDPFRGSVERRVLGEGESLLMLECQAAQEAIAAAGLTASEIELAIVASIFPETVGFGNASSVVRQLDLPCPAWNLESTCSSALIALQNASALMQTGEYRNALVVVSHGGSRAVDENDSLSWSMGDAAGAFIVDFLKPNQGILSRKIVHTAATSEAYAHDLEVDERGTPQMRIRTGENASILAETAADYVRICCDRALAAAGVALDQIDFFACNTPTAWYASVCTQALGLPPERTLNLYPRYANIGSVFPLASLYHAARSGQLRQNDLVLVYTNGAAATAAATVMRWGEVALGSPPAPPLGVTSEQEKIRIPAPSETPATSGPFSREELLAAEPAAQQQILEAYLLGCLANVQQRSPGDRDRQCSLALELDSLAALMLKNRLETDLQISVPIAQFFGDSTPEKLARFLLTSLNQGDRHLPSTALPTLVPAPERRYDPFPLTDMQYAYWVGRSGVLELGQVANHGYYEIEGKDLDLERLNRALQQLIERHEMLRAVVLPEGQQQVLETVPPYQIEVVDLRGKSDEFVKAQIEEIRDRLSHQVLPTDRWPLFDFRATRLEEGRVRLHLSYDLQIFDAWSLFRLFDEWFQLYQNLELALPPLEISFRDYVLAEQTLHQTELYRRSRDYWLSRIDRLPPAPELPLAKTPQELTHPRTRRYEAQLNPTDWQQLQQRAARAGLTPSGVLLAAFAEILTGWSKRPEFTLNLALFNRLPLHPQINDILGDFTSATLLAVHNLPNESFRDRARRLQHQLWQDLEHLHFSGVRVVRELARRNQTAPSPPPVIFTSTLGFRSLGQETLTFSHFGELVYGISQASQAWMDVQVWEEKGKLTFNWDVVEDLFPEGLIAEMFAAYCRLLQQLAASDSAWVETTRQLLPPTQRAQREAVNATAAPISDALLHELFAARVRDRDREPAIIAPDRALSYTELYERSNRLARKLRSLGVAPNQVVAVVMEKGWEQIVAVMGILTSGAAYVPLDPHVPPERLAYLLDHSTARIAIAQSGFREKLASLENLQLLCLEDADIAEETPLPLESLQRPEDLAYLIYTSGSTGVPKGVAIEHRSAVNTILDLNQRFAVCGSDRVLALSALNFDLSVYDIFGILAAGGTVVLPEAAQERDPEHWSSLIRQHEVTIWNSVPALIQMLLDSTAEWEVWSHLRLILLSGDWLPLTLPTQIKALNESAQVISLGGATEAAIWSILYPIRAVDPAWKSIPYGYPMLNQQFHVLDEALEPRPVWVPGQLYIGGLGLARGYWRDEEKTAASFMTHPRTGERLYRTGDLGRYLPDGAIEFLGREDFQVKIRGYRIELGEIEAVLGQHPAVGRAVVTAIGDPSGDKRAIAYVVPKMEIDRDELHRFLGSKLPQYMLPSAIVFLESFPLSANGKIDRRSLPLPEHLSTQWAASYVAPQTDLEQIVATVWQAVLDLEKVGVDDNFFEIGGNSLLIVKIHSKLKKVVPNKVECISLVDLFKYPTIRSLSKFLSSGVEPLLLPTPKAELTRQREQGKNRLKQRFKKVKSG